MSTFDAVTGSDPSRSRRALFAVLVGFTIFALCFYGIFYLYDYRDGDSIAPTSIKLIKDLVWTIVLLFLLSINTTRARIVDHLRQPYNLVLLTFCAWLVAVKVVEVFAYGNYNTILLTLKNAILYAAMVPLLGMLCAEAKRSLVKYVSVVFVAVAFIQAIFSAALFASYPEYSFWRDDPYNGFNPFVGLFSNPNRFGLFLNLGAAVLCGFLLISPRKEAFFAAVGLILLALSIFYTAALSQLVVYFGLLTYATIVAAWTMGRLCLRFSAITLTSAIVIGLVGLNCKSPLPDASHNESALAWDLRNLAALAVNGQTLDGKSFHFTSDSIVNRMKEIGDLGESFAQNASSRQSGDNRGLKQRLVGLPDHMAPSSQSQFAYIYFRYGLIGVVLFAGVLAVPAIRGLLGLTKCAGRDDSYRMLFCYHLCLVAFIATFLGDNGLLDFPTNFLLFFVLFANQSLFDPAIT
ncbi:hypothetical protein [Bradyrhizobium sp. PRIMUS42]|uniref:hypothetical protein n=1 Tax=Bradyrhizobium sp. PRIMUS42 TaxID=2908926 RepID=UPI001FF66177|nr:hypothetical protein [Bradyrhizobium sp. PRIMUS42]MCJ9729390.1 hypothetical protein [Bradyrhizobium sp. PRIMUS42]